MRGLLETPRPPQSPSSRQGQSRTFSKWWVFHRAAASAASEAAWGAAGFSSQPWATLEKLLVFLIH